MLLISGLIVIACGLAVIVFPTKTKKGSDVLNPENYQNEPRFIGETSGAPNETLEKNILAALSLRGLSDEDHDLALEALRSIGKESYDPKIYRRVLEQTTTRITSDT